MWLLLLSRWKDNPALPVGLVYEGVSEEPLSYSGGSAAQSTILHAFDEFLGVRHSKESGKSAIFLFSRFFFFFPYQRGRAELFLPIGKSNSREESLYSSWLTRRLCACHLWLYPDNSYQSSAECWVLLLNFKTLLNFQQSPVTLFGSLGSRLLFLEWGSGLGTEAQTLGLCVAKSGCSCW